MKIVNTSEETLKESINNGDIHFVDKLEKEHPTTIIELNEANHTVQWCPGCGNFGIIMSIKKAIIKLALDPKNVVVVSGIGCSSKLPHYIKTFGLETIHGRALPCASGVKLGNKDLHVIVVGGDGDGYGIGMGHLIHTMRRNINLTYIVHNNEIYGLTKGQTSPTSAKGLKTVSTPNGAIETPVNPMALAITGGATYIAKGFAGDIEGLSNLIAKGIEHKGFSIIDVCQPCVSYNPKMSYQWYQERVYKIEEEVNYDPKNKVWAMTKALEEQEAKIPIGVFYHSDNDRETYIDDLPEDKIDSLVKQDIENINIENLLDNFE